MTLRHRAIGIFRVGLIGSWIVFGFGLADACGSEARAPTKANTQRYSFSFAQPEILRGKEFDRVVAAGLESWGEVGAPALPRRLVRILLPEHSRVDSVRIEAGRWFRIDGAVRIEPTQPLHRPFEDTLPGPTMGDPAIYAGSAPYPKSTWRQLGVGFKHGRSVLLLSLHPVRWSQGELSYVRFMNVEVVTQPKVQQRERVTPSNAWRGRHAALESFVDNPETLLRPEGIAAGVVDEVAYAIVTTSALAAAFEPLAAARAADGLPAEIVTLETIRQRYTGIRPDGGADDATRIREFARDYYENRGLQYLLLGGDADADANCAECEEVIVPTRYLHAFSATPLASDVYFGCLDGSFDGDADGIYGEPNDGEDGGDIDFLFELHVGRAPVDSIEEAENFVQKTLTYDRLNGAVLRDVLFVGERLGFGGRYDFAGNLNDFVRSGSNEFISTLGLDSPASPFRDFFNIETLYDRDTIGNDWPVTRLTAHLERGVHVVNHIGHADISNVMKLTNADIDAIDERVPFLLYTQSCYAGSFDNRRTDGGFSADSVAEHFLTGTTGAAAIIANSRRGWAGTQTPDGPSQRFNRWFWDAVVRQGVLQWGAANDASKESSIAYSMTNERGRWCFYDLNTLGDPALTIRLASSRATLSLDREHYVPGDTATILLIDADLNDDGDTAQVVPVPVSTASGALEMVSLTETGRSSGVFQGSIELSESPGTAGSLAVTVPDQVTVRYTDADTGGGSSTELEAGAAVSGMLEFSDQCPRVGYTGVPYGESLTAVGGSSPYRFVAETGYVEETGGVGFEGLGVPQGWRDDDGFWIYALPFRFPFYGQFRESVVVSSNGYLQFGSGNERDFDNRIEGLVANSRIAPFWADLVTDGNGNIYIDEKLDSVTIRWRGTGYSTDASINVEVELFADGRIRFAYGDGNENLSPTIGISAGDGERFLVSSLSGQDDLGSASTLLYLPSGLPAGLTVDAASGALRGIPTAVGQTEVSFSVRDASGQSARRRCVIDIRPDGLSTVAPAAGELWLRESLQQIRWEWFGDIGSQVRLDYNTDGSTENFPFEIATGIPVDARSFEWTLPALESERARVRVRSEERPEFTTYSEVFSVVGPTIVVETPRSDVDWFVGSPAAVRWRTVGATGSRVRIEYNTDGSDSDFPHILAADAPNSGEFTGVVPATPSATCRLRVSSTSVASAIGVSDAFAIRVPFLRLIAPNGGDCLRAGSTAQITWSSGGNTGESVALEYNIDGSADNFPFAIGTGEFSNNGSAEWEVPDLVGDDVRLRIRSTDTAAIDISDRTFSIAERCALRVVFWIPFIGALEEQVVGSLAALERFEPDAEVSFSASLTPPLLEQDLDDQDAFVILRQKDATATDVDELGEALRPIIGEFVGRGGALVVCQQPEFNRFLAAAGIVDAVAIGGGRRLCELDATSHPLAVGVRPNFSGPRDTVWYASADIEAAGLEAVASAGEGTVVVASRPWGFGRLSVLGFDYRNHSGDTARILANGVRVPLPRSGVRFVSPAPGAVFQVGDEIPVEWYARGEASGTVRVRYNTDGSSSEFPLTATIADSNDGHGTFVWSTPEPAPDAPFLRVGLELRSLNDPAARDVLLRPLFVARPLRVLTEALPEGNVGLPYQAEIEIDGGVPPYRFGVERLPRGLAVQMTGESTVEIVGVPQEVCPLCDIDVTVTDSVGLTTTTGFSLPVTLREIDLSSPNGGELWLFASQQEVRWSRSGNVGSTVNIRFNTDGSRLEFPSLVAESVPIDQPFLWQLPVVDAAACRLRIQSNEFPEIVDVSEVFSIVGPTIRLDVPNGEECWEPGKARTIRWQSTGNPEGGIRIEYNTDGSLTEFPHLVASGAPDSGRFDWQVPDLLSEQLRVRVSFEAGPEIQDSSDDTFQVLEECSVSVLVWAPCPVPPQASTNVLDAVRDRLEGADIQFSDADVSEVPELLTNRDTLVILLASFCRALDYAALGRELEPLLAPFVAAGGNVVFSAPGPVSGQLLAGLDLTERLNLFAAQAGIPLDIEAPAHPLAAGVSLEFFGPALTYVYRITGSGWQDLLTHQGLTVAAAREEGRGRWVLLGFDFEQRAAESDRVLANAVRGRPLLPALRVVRPMGGDVFAAGDTVTIRWAAQSTGAATMRLSFNVDGSMNSFPFDIAEVDTEAGAGEFLWIAPTPADGELYECRVLVESGFDPAISAVSEEVFFVTPRRLTLVTDSLVDGFQGADYSSEVRVAGGEPPYFVETQGLPAGLFPLPPDGVGPAIIEGIPLVTGTDVQVLVRVIDSLGTVAERVLSMNVFPSRLDLVNPAGGEFFLAGSEVELRWNVIGNAGTTAKIEYNLDGFTNTFPFLAAESVPIDEVFVWRVPDATSDLCRLRVTSNEIGLSATTVRTFTISPAGMTCLFPNGAEVFEAATTQTIRWRSLGNVADRVRIDLDLDGGVESFPIVVARDVPDTGEYSWRLPSAWEDSPLLSESCRIRIASEEDGSFRDASDQSFAIRYRTPVRGLIWVPFTGFDRAEVRGATAAITVFENDFEWTLSKALSEVELQRDLRGKECFILVEQDPQSEVNFKARGRLLGPVLREFARRGGSLIVLKQREASNEFLRAAELLDVTEIGRQFDTPLRNVAPADLAMDGVPDVFSAAASTGWYDLRTTDAEVLAVTETGHPVVVARRIGDGRVLLVGADFRDYTDAAARLLANATRPTVRKESTRFVRGDVNADSFVDLSDAVFLLQYLFFNGPEPSCLDAADTDDSARADVPLFPLGVSDAIRVLNWLFLDGPRPSPPSPSGQRFQTADCGEDPRSRDGLSCGAYSHCE